MRHLKLFESFDGAEPWWAEYKKYDLHTYPVNIPKEDVTIDLSGDIDTHPVMTWYSPKTGKKVYAYTKARMDAQQNKKYARTSTLSDDELERIKMRTHEDIVSEDTPDSVKDAAAVVSIIAQTGLRPGSREGFMKTQNRGVLTLAKDNISIDGPIIRFDFTGKSYKHNVSEVKDGVLANYLESKIEQADADFVFDVTKNVVDRYYKQSLGMKNYKIKDLRTYIAGKLAKWFLSEHRVTASEPKAIKKEVKNILKETFEYVSNKLNNSPAMAKGSYVNPAIIDEWLDQSGIRTIVMTEETQVPDSPKRFIGDAPMYDMPDWWDDEDIELVKE